MTNSQRSKVKMQAKQSIADSDTTQGARRATEGVPESGPAAVQSGSQSEVVARAQRGHFSSADKRRILNGGCQDSCRIKLVAQAASCVG